MYTIQLTKGDIVKVKRVNEDTKAVGLIEDIKYRVGYVDYSDDKNPVVGLSGILQMFHPNTFTKA